MTMPLQQRRRARCRRCSSSRRRCWTRPKALPLVLGLVLGLMLGLVLGLLGGHLGCSTRALIDTSRPPPWDGPHRAHAPHKGTRKGTGMGTGTVPTSLTLPLVVVLVLLVAVVRRIRCTRCLCRGAAPWPHPLCTASHLLLLSPLLPLQGQRARQGALR